MEGTAKAAWIVNDAATLGTSVCRRGDLKLVR